MTDAAAEWEVLQWVLVAIPAVFLVLSIWKAYLEGGDADEG